MMRLQELGGDHCSFGDFTLTITVWDEDEQTATEKARAVQQVVDGVGLVSEIEDFNAVQAWMGSLPGHAYADVRRPLISSLNVCDLVPLSAVWSGPAQCAHLNGPPLLVTRTKGSTPFRLSLHQGDVGHTIIAGPTGAGKSTLLNLLACQWLRYPGARVYIFDKGASCRAMTLAMGGDFYDLGGEGDEICFQPLAGIDDESELAWAQDWVADLLHREKAEVTPATKQELWARAFQSGLDAARAAHPQHAPGHCSGCRCAAGDAELHARRTAWPTAGCESGHVEPTMAVNMERAGRRSRWNT